MPRGPRTAGTLLSLVLAPALGGCDTSSAAADGELTSAEAWRLIQQHDGDAAFVILDVRTQEEFDAGHIEGAVLIDFYAADFEAQIDLLPRSRVYFVYCRSGNRSGQTATLMEQMGFLEVFNLTEGFTEWVAGGYPWTSL